MLGGDTAYPNPAFKSAMARQDRQSRVGVGFSRVCPPNKCDSG